MKLKSLLFLTFFLIVSLSFAQRDNQILIKYPTNVEDPLTDKERDMIEEVYKSKSKTLIYDNDEQLKAIKHLLRNRILIYEESNPKFQKKTKLLSQVPLNSEYNPNIKRDTEYNKSSFNPLKYKLDFFSNGTYLYRIDGTNYFIQVTSQYRTNK